MISPVAQDSASPADVGGRPIAGTSAIADERTRVLKHDDTFAVFDHYGDVKPGGLGEEGLYHEGTRYLSAFVLELGGVRPVCLGSNVRDENDQLAVDLTNPDLDRGARPRVPLGTLHLTLKKFLWRAVCYQQVRVKNYGPDPVATTLALRFRADYADIFEVRGLKRKARGQDLASEVGIDRVTLGYRGLDGEERHTDLHFTPRPDRLTPGTARFDLELPPRAEATITVATVCRRGSAVVPVLPFDAARAEAEAELERHRSSSCLVRTPHGPFNDWVRRAESDFHVMTSATPTGPYPYAGVPWFNTPFGRDGIITALECLWLNPGLSRGVLAYLATTQATEVIPDQDAEPGKILHETRNGEMAVLKEMPFGRYYGSVDATPLFVLLAGAYYERTGDRAFVESIWPNVEAALAWIDRYGDRDGDGFVEYHRQKGAGLLHQGWKDSDDAVFHADGSPAEGPVALCEVQGYVYAAKRAGAVLAALFGQPKRVKELIQESEDLRGRFDESFWCDDLDTYALALDGGKRPCRVRSSNAGHCLFTGIATPQRARRLAHVLLGPDSFSGWGVRTVATSESRYNPMSYHNGTVWPHDNALIAVGLARYGLQELALPILTGLFEAGLAFDLHRMPELFCGFPRHAGEGPVVYPVACAPQSWAASSVFLLVQASLGLSVNGPQAQVSFHRPRLPEFLDELSVTRLGVAGATVDLRLTRHEREVSVNVVRREGEVEVIVVN